MTQNNEELPFNPFNPIKTYRLYSSRSQTIHQTNRQNSVQLVKQQNGSTNPYNQMGITNYALFIRNSENKGLKSDQNFQAYIQRLEENRKLSKNLIQKTKQQQKHESMQTQQFEDDTKKTSHGPQIKNTAKDQKKEKFQHQITEMIAEIKSPFYKKGRYLLNEDKDKEKKLAKPLFYGIQNQTKQQQRRKLVFSQIDINKLRYKIFFDDYNPLSRMVTSQQSQQKEETVNESPLKTDQQFFIEQ
ncbi:unnamed protein product (macronuclear) [Paramecium tetraurelia]|uniref:Uncharacterized protein n=1 Tax=Paramecium tetraurelia TaxID=5888 RepID=A0EHU6_PARTE|nr:uncharacterized protein GSPATT00027214001 [Paramecium tetraurelia]CAK94887.1 unnamed protein product [Paramecium tetraurelia]|eukprot:XP_001462260.1 hypothetical protein (macronuclear) [Paramecium tetraurelia strain d4-2]